MARPPRQENPSISHDVEMLLEERDALARQRFLEEDPAATLTGTAGAGQTIGAYRLHALLGGGGMGTVWLARRSDGRFEGNVAIKPLNLSLLGPEGEARFRREGNVLARLSPAERLQALVEHEPTRLFAVAARNTGTHTAANRASTPEKLERLLSGDLENIAAKALRKKPGER